MSADLVDAKDGAGDPPEGPRDDVADRRGRKIAKFAVFSIVLALIPYATSKYDMGEFYFVAIAIVLAGLSEMLFDRVHSGKSGFVFLGHVCAGLVFCVYGAILYGAATVDDRSVASAATNAATVPHSADRPHGLPTAPPAVLLGVAVVLGTSAVFFSEAKITEQGLHTTRRPA